MGRKQTEETKQKIRESWRATHPPISEETREKMRLSHLGKKRTEEFCQKNGERTKGKKYSLGYHHTDEHKQMMSSLKRGVPMSETTREKLRDAWIRGRENRIGENAPAWKGGVTPLNMLIRNNEETARWRQIVFRRDRWTCQSCGVKTKDLHAHHIKEFSSHPELRFDENNGITMCRSCHIELHRRAA